jgi:tetraacyldisaccharide 4'-kinase
MSDFKTNFRFYATGRTSGWWTGPLTLLLLPASLMYRLVVFVRNSLFDLRLLSIEQTGIPVISVGNIAAGGTGKTPVVDFIARYLTNKGCMVGIVSRGYGGNFKGAAALVSDGSSKFLDADSAGDEPFLLAQRNAEVAVAISPKRIDGVRLLIERCQVDCVILDDAFQHRSIARDFDIVLLDGQRPKGNGHLLPAGILREPFSSVRRADLAILTRCQSLCPDQSSLPVPVIKCQHKLANQVVNLHGGVLALEDLTGKKVFAFAGIAEPETFFSSLREAGIQLSGTFAFPDHVVYSTTRLAILVSAAQDSDLFLTTEKDAVKIDPSGLPLPCYSIGVQPVFENESTLLQLIDQLIDKEKCDD